VKIRVIRGKNASNVPLGNESNCTRINTSIALKAGVIGTVAGIVFAVLTNVIPFLICVACWVGPVIGLVTGALYVHFSGKVEFGEGAVGGALSGAIGGAGSGLVNSIFSLLGAGAGAASSLLGGEGGAAAAAAGGGVVGFLTALVGGIVGGAVLGAVGGLVYAAIKSK